MSAANRESNGKEWERVVFFMYIVSGNFSNQIILLDNLKFDMITKILIKV